MQRKDRDFSLLAFCFACLVCWFPLYITWNEVEASLQSPCLCLKTDTMWWLLSSKIGSREKFIFPLTIAFWSQITAGTKQHNYTLEQAFPALRGYCSRYLNDRLSTSFWLTGSQLWLQCSSCYLKLIWEQEKTSKLAQNLEQISRAERIELHHRGDI